MLKYTWEALQGFKIPYVEWQNFEHRLKSGVYSLIVDYISCGEEYYTADNVIHNTKIHFDSSDEVCPLKIKGEDHWKCRQFYGGDWLIVDASIFDQQQPQQQPQQQTGEKMTQQTGIVMARKTVRIELIDNDAGLDVSLSLVAAFDNVVTEDDNATTIQELILNEDIAAKLKEHNELRAKQTDLDVLKRTGNEVKLQPVKLKQLTWVVK